MFITPKFSLLFAGKYEVKGVNNGLSFSKRDYGKEKSPIY